MHTSGQIVIYDEPTECPYLPEQTARLPLRLPARPVQGEEFDQAMEGGDRRTGAFLYRTRCPRCRQCEPIRIEVDQFSPGRTQRRVKRRGDRLLEVHVGTPTADRERLRLFNAHREERGLGDRDGELSLSEYSAFLVDSCCDTIEMQYRLDKRLVAVAIIDVGQASLSAVYCYFDPAFDRLSLGVYSILKQIEYCQLEGLKYLYLGYYIADSKHMSYKAQYSPHQRLLAGEWRSYP